MTEKEMKKSIRKLASRWRGGCKWYQCIDFTGSVSTEPHSKGMARKRTEIFIPLISKYLKPEDVVLDMGCNAGYFTYLSSEICQKAIGVEIHDAFYKQALFVAEVLKSQGKDLSKATILNCDIIKNLDVFKDVTVVFASKVLYHKNLGDGLDILMDAIKNSPTRIVLAQGHVTQGEIGQSEGMQRIFDDIGFSYALINNDPDYPVAIAERR